MGATRRQAEAEFFGIRGSNFTKRVDQKTDYSKSRELEKGENKGKTIHEEEYSELSGHLKSIAVEQAPFGLQLRFKLDHDDESFVISIPFDGRYSTNLINRLSNCDIHQFIELSPYHFDNEGKTQAGITIRQGMGKIGCYHTKDNPNGLPQPLKSENVSGQVKWDFTPQLKFFKEVVKSMNRELTDKPVDSRVDDDTVPGPQIEPENEYLDNPLSA